MSYVKKYWDIVFFLLAVGIKIFITSPLETQYNLTFKFGIDLMYEHEGIIDKIDENKYCKLMFEISGNESANCHDNLQSWKKMHSDDRIKINKGIKTSDRLDAERQKMERKIEISSWFSWGLIFVFIVVTYFNQRK